MSYLTFLIYRHFCQQVLEDLIVALRLQPPKSGEEPMQTSDGATAAATPSTSQSEENKENSTPSSTAPSSATEDVICSQPVPTGDFPPADGAAASAAGTADQAKDVEMKEENS